MINYEMFEYALTIRLILKYDNKISDLKIFKPYNFYFIFIIFAPSIRL